MTQAYNLSQFANFVNASGQVSAAGLQPGVVVSSGTVMLFYQSAAPTGWTQVTSLNDYALRIVSSAGGNTGGTSAFSTVFANQTLSVSVSGSVGATTLSTAQIASHTHAVPIFDTANFGSNPAYTAESGPIYGSKNSDAAGGGGSHSHSFSGSGSTSAITLNVRYANIILCSKN